MTTSSTTTTETAATERPRDWPTRLKALVSWARWAPSSHNSQPWQVVIDENVLELRPDRRRSTPVVDPEDRELAISCGAFLFHLRVAARHDGLTSHITLLPRTDDPVSRDLGLGHAPVFARVAFAEARNGDARGEPLFTAIPARRTWRLPFHASSVDDGEVRRLAGAALREGARLDVVDGVDARLELCRLVSAGDRQQWHDPAFRAELSRWLAVGREGEDGVTLEGVGGRDALARFAPAVVRTFDLGDRRAAHDEALAHGSPVLAVLSTHGDEERDWLTAGQALDRVLLTATSHGLAASFLNQPVEIPVLRERLRQLLRTPLFPQVVLRIGVPGTATPAPSPRRPVEELIVA